MRRMGAKKPGNENTLKKTSERQSAPVLTHLRVLDRQQLPGGGGFNTQRGVSSLASVISYPCYKLPLL